jgi:hypothetical protein
VGAVEVIDAVVRGSSRAFQAVPDAVGSAAVGAETALSDAVVFVILEPGDRLMRGTAIRMTSAAPNMPQRRAVGGWAATPAPS